MKSTRSYLCALRDSSERSCKSRCIVKKTVMFSSKVKLRSFAKSHNLWAQSSWITDEEFCATKKRAKNLSILHQIKTRQGKPTPSKRSGIVYNCHPAHYEIIGESLRGMEHYTDVSIARRVEWFRSNATSLVEERQNLHKTNRSKLACMYKEKTKEAMVHSRKIAEEDAKAAAAILAEDLKEDVVNVAPPPPSPASPSSSATIPLDSARSLAFRPSQNKSTLEHLATQTSAFRQALPPTIPINPNVPIPTEPNLFISSITPVALHLLLADHKRKSYH